MDSIKFIANNCPRCVAQELCSTVTLEKDTLAILDEIIDSRNTIHKGDFLFKENESFLGVYVVRSGSFKLFKLMGAGDERIMGFYFPGNLIGFDAAHNNMHEFSAIALETSSYCRLSLEMLFKMASKNTQFQRQLFLLMSQEVAHNAEILLNTTAEQRVAKFLLSLSERFKERGLSEKKFHLSMSREDIGKYLGLATETISRLFTYFQEKGVIEIKQRNISIVNLSELDLIEKGRRSF